MAKELGGLKIEFGDPRQPKALPLSHPKARWGEFGTETFVLRKGTVRRRGCLALPCDIKFERDVPVHLRDGTRIFVDVFRPVDDSIKAPALMAWSPYGKQPGKGNQVLDDFPFRMGVPLSKLSELQKWEGPDPAYWVQYGYAIVNPDPRGVGKSEGDIYNFGSQEGRDGADVVDWIGSQPWCNGRVSMSGNSYLSISQWFIAAERPRHLAAIAPWEGFSDLYRESGTRGGVESRAAATFLLQILQVNCGENSWENTLMMQHLYPEFKEYHKDKAAKVENIDVPAYVTASWSNPIHTYGTFRAFSRLQGPKWLRVHDSWEWPDYYDEANRTDLHRFFDRFLKDIDNGWENTPSLRAKILDTGNPAPLTGSDLVSNAFPPTEMKPKKLFLHQSSLSPVYPPSTSVTYKASKEEKAFEYTFDRDTICCGPVEMALAVSLTKAIDSEVFASFEKVLVSGAVGEQLKIPYERGIQSTLIKTAHHTGLVPVTKVLMYRGPYGQIRLSRRTIDKGNDIRGFPVSLMEEIEVVPEEKILHVQLAVTPMGMSFAKGEKLRVIIGGVDKAVYPPVDQATLTLDDAPVEIEVAKEGIVKIHCGLPDVSQASYIVLPTIY